MDKKELYKRVLAELRDLGSGESLSVVGLAEEMGEPDSVIADVLEILHRHNYAWCSGRGCYSPSPKCRKATTDEIMSELGGCTTEKPRPEPEPVKEDHATQELRPSADRVCRFCGKVMEPNKLRRHENCCGKNPDRVAIYKRHPELEVVPAPSEYADLESNASTTIEHEVPVEPEFPEFLEQLNAEDPDVPDEVPDYSPANNAADQDTLLAGFLERVRAQDALVLKGSPGMDAALRLISFCQQASESGANVHLNASVKVGPGFYVSVSLEDQGRSQ